MDTPPAQKKKRRKKNKPQTLTYTLFTFPLSLLRLQYYKHTPKVPASAFLTPETNGCFPMKTVLQSNQGRSWEDVSMGEGDFNITTHPSTTSIKLFCSKFILSNSRSKLMLENANHKSTQTFTPPCLLDLKRKQETGEERL